MIVTPFISFSFSVIIYMKSAMMNQTYSIAKMLPAIFMNALLDRAIYIHVEMSSKLFKALSACAVHYVI